MVFFFPARGECMETNRIKLLQDVLCCKYGMFGSIAVNMNSDSTATIRYSNTGYSIIQHIMEQAVCTVQNSVWL